VTDRFKPLDNSSGPLDEQALCRHARGVGDELRENLLAAAAATNGWQDREAARQQVAEILQTALDRLAATGCWGAANRLPSGELWRVAGDWLTAGWLQHHARTKPRGYAGAFEMLHKICDRWLSDDPLGRAFDQFFQNQAAPAAVRNRAQIVADQIVAAVRRREGQTCRVVSVGAGPGSDIALAAEQLTRSERSRLRVVLLDLDSAALAFARRQLSHWLAADQIASHRENLFRLPRLARAGNLLSGADFIACPGLFDYLSDHDAGAMLSCFWKHLATAGQAIVFQFAPTNPSRAYMEWIGNWYLTYRTADAFAEITRNALPADSAFQIHQESSGASLRGVFQKN